MATPSSHPLNHFLNQLVPKVAQKTKQVNQALWILETTGAKDAAELKAELDTELRLLFHDSNIYQQLQNWSKDPTLQDPLLKRQLNVLLRAFKQNQIPDVLVQQIAAEEAALALAYASFRPSFEGKTVSENDLRELMKEENRSSRRKKIWEASKEIGALLAPKILSLVELRNRAAKSLGYPDYFQMQLDLQEVNSEWLFATLDALAKQSEQAHSLLIKEIEEQQATQFKVDPHELGPWAWTDPFGQEDPLDVKELDTLVANLDLQEACRKFYRLLGFDVDPILARSDLFEREGKNQHAFCINIDRKQDVRTLNNLKPSIKWLETLLHELGHAIYELGFDPSLPWLLREPPHMIPTEAMALLAGRQAYRYESLRILTGEDPEKDALRRRASQSLQRRQLLFSRWVLVMTHFESELYRNPSQDLNALWWSLVEKYQKIPPPALQSNRQDWAAKYHIGLAPIYYFSYLLGELFASAIEEYLAVHMGTSVLTGKPSGQFLREKLFFPGNRMNWFDLIIHVTNQPLHPDAWIEEFVSTQKEGKVPS